MRRRRAPKPLYRRVNTTAHNVHHHEGGDFAEGRAKSKGEEHLRESMSRGIRRGLDYTPLFRFLLGKVNLPWEDTYREAVRRLDREDPIWWLVAHQNAPHLPICRIGESSYYHGLYVDEEGILRLVAPAIGPESLLPYCTCCTHTLDGVQFTRPHVSLEEAIRVWQKTLEPYHD